MQPRYSQRPQTDQLKYNRYRMPAAVRTVYIISKIDKALAFEWIAGYIRKDKVELHFILLNSKESRLENFLKKNNIPVNRVDFKDKKDTLRAIWNIFLLLKKIKPEIVHTHLFEASLCGLTAAFFAGVKKRIHTRHHSSYHHMYFPSAIKYDRWINHLSTAIVAISENVKKILIEKEKADPEKIHIIHHGFKLESFDNINSEKITLLKKKYHIIKNRPVIGVISRYTQWKGVQYIVPAFKLLLARYPGAVLILCNAKGEYSEAIKNLLREINPESYREIEFESDLFTLYKMFDVFIHVPIDNHSEAFGQTYVEALAAGIPSVFTLSGVASEFVVNKKNALTVSYKNIQDIFLKTEQILEDPGLRKILMENGKTDVYQMFRLEMMVDKLEKLYMQDRI